jgi:hypothetical protein
VSFAVEKVYSAYTAAVASRSYKDILDPQMLTTRAAIRPDKHR